MTEKLIKFSLGSGSYSCVCAPTHVWWGFQETEETACVTFEFTAR